MHFVNGREKKSAHFTQFSSKVSVHFLLVFWKFIDENRNLKSRISTENCGDGGGKNWRINNKNDGRCPVRCSASISQKQYLKRLTAQ